MTLQFEYRPSYGHVRYYPLDDAARAVCRVAGRVSLTEHMIEVLRVSGFEVEIFDAATAVRRIL